MKNRRSLDAGVAITVFLTLSPPLWGQGLIIIHCKDNVDFVTIDPQGRRTGIDALAAREYGELPYANYGAEGYDAHDDPTNPGVFYTEFFAGEEAPLIEGKFRLKIVGVEQGKYDLTVRVAYGSTKPRTSSLTANAVPGRVDYYEFNYSNNPSVYPNVVPVPRASQVKGGLFNPTGSTLSVKAKPSVNFGAGNTLNSLIVTLRRLTSPSVTLGTVSSPTYGFVKMGADTTIGSYKYQKFITTANTPLNWVAGTEYELFTVPVQGGNGNTVTFELTNALAFGQYFVEINYSDKTDTMFYSSSVTFPTVPAPPVLISPFNREQGVSTNPTLRWNASSGATSYRLQVSTRSNFSTTVVNQGGITTTSYTVQGLQGGVKYYWRVNATNAGGTSAYSSVYSFTTRQFQESIKK